MSSDTPDDWSSPGVSALAVVVVRQDVGIQDRFSTHHSSVAARVGHEGKSP